MLFRIFCKYVESYCFCVSKAYVKYNIPSKKKIINIFSKIIGIIF